MSPFLSLVNPLGLLGQVLGFFESATEEQRFSSSPSTPATVPLEILQFVHVVQDGAAHLVATEAKCAAGIEASALLAQARGRDTELAEARASLRDAFFGIGEVIPRLVSAANRISAAGFREQMAPVWHYLELLRVRHEHCGLMLVAFGEEQDVPPDLVRRGRELRDDALDDFIFRHHDEAFRLLA